MRAGEPSSPISQAVASFVTGRAGLTITMFTNRARQYSKHCITLLIFITTLQVRSCFYLHFTGGETIWGFTARSFEWDCEPQAVWLPSLNSQPLLSSHLLQTYSIRGSRLMCMEVSSRKPTVKLSWFEHSCNDFFFKYHLVQRLLIYTTWRISFALNIIKATKRISWKNLKKYSGATLYI